MLADSAAASATTCRFHMRATNNVVLTWRAADAALRASGTSTRAAWSSLAMERYSQYRDRGTGVAPFFPVTTESSTLTLPFHVFLFVCRLPLLLLVAAIYFLLLGWLPVGSLGRKAALWLMLGIPGVWWIDLQIDGVKRGSLAKQDKKRLPHSGTVIASSFTSPLDALYLAAIFDPIFTISYPSTGLVRRASCFQAILHALTPPATTPPPKATLVPIARLIALNPEAPVVVFPECTTSNGRGILPFSPSLLTVPARTKIFPVSLRYTPADVTSPLPGTHLKFLWNLCSRPTHCIRVRVAEAVFNSAGSKLDMSTSSSGRNHSPEPKRRLAANALEGTLLGQGITEYGEMDMEETSLIDRVGEDLARLGRAKRVGLGVKEKLEFIGAWTKKRR